MKSGIHRARILAFHLLVWTILPLMVVLMPREGTALVVIAPFASSGALGVMAQADGELVAATRFESVAVVTSQKPGLAARLYAAGALLVLDGARVPGCLPTEKATP